MFFFYLLGETILSHTFRQDTIPFLNLGFSPLYKTRYLGSCYITNHYLLNEETGILENAPKSDNYRLNFNFRSYAGNSMYYYEFNTLKCEEVCYTFFFI